MRNETISFDHTPKIWIFSRQKERRFKKRYRRLKVVILRMNALRRFGEGDPQMHAAQIVVVHVDERMDGLLQRRHRDVRHFAVVLKKLEENHLAVLPEGRLNFSFGRALGDVGNVQCRRRLEDIRRILGTGLLEPMKRGAGVIFG